MKKFSKFIFTQYFSKIFFDDYKIFFAEIDISQGSFEEENKI